MLIFAILVANVAESKNIFNTSKGDILFSSPDSIVPGGNIDTCRNFSVTLTVTGAPAGSSFQWISLGTNGSFNNIGNNQATYTVTNGNINNSGNYTCIIDSTPSAGGGKDTQNIVNIQFYNTPNFSINSSNTSICFGASTNLSINSSNNIPYGTFTWSPSTGLSATTGEQVTASPTTSTTYTVVGNRFGCTRTETIALSVNPKPTAGFTFLSSGGCGKKITFTNTSTPGSGATFGSNSYQWDFGDGDQSNSSNSTVTHEYDPPGGGGPRTFNVKLIVTNSYGCKDTIIRSVTIAEQPDARLLGNNQVSINGQIYFKICSNVASTFTFFNTSLTKNTINTRYVIKWGDATPNYDSTAFRSPSITHTYPVGTYTLWLYVYAGSCVDSAKYIVFIGNVPSGGITNAGGATICSGSMQPFVLSGVSGNPDGTIYVVSFNDNSQPDTFYQYNVPDTIFHSFNSSSCGITSSNGIRTYNNAYAGYINISNPCGDASGSALPVYVSATPVSDFRITPKDTICKSQVIGIKNTGNLGNDVSSSGCTPGKSIWTISPDIPGTRYTLLYGSLGNDGGGIPDPFAWTSGSDSISVRFDSVGVYTILLVTANATLCGLDTMIKKICVNPSPTADFNLTKTLLCVNDTLTAISITNTPTCGANTYKWIVSYVSPIPSPNGPCSPTLTPSIISTLTTANPVISYANPGIYSISLQTFAPALSCSSNIVNKYDTVKSKPIVNLTVQSNICISQNLTPSITNSCFVQNATYNWSIAPSTGVVIPSPNSINPGGISLPSVGSYTLTVSVTNECGTTQVVQQITVNPLPTVTVSVNNPVICSGTSTAITAVPSVAGTYNYSWTVPSGASNPGNVATFNASVAGTYSVIITNTSTNCSSVRASGLVTVNPVPPVSVGSTVSPICIGGSTTLNASGADTYTWSPSAGLSATTGATVSANPSASTTYSVTGTTTATGCQNTANITVTVNPLPVVTTSNNVSICIGSSTTLTANSSGANTYSWSPSTGLSATTGASVTANPTVTTTYTVTGTRTNTGCQNNATVTVTVNALPVVTVSPTSPSICIGSSTSLSAGGANTYIWSPSTGLSATTGATVNAFPTTSTTYTVTGTDANSCKNSATSTVTVNPLPTITGPINVCQNSNITLVGSVTPAAVNPWVSSNTTFATISNTGVVTGLTVGTTTITYTDNLGCQKTFNVTVKQTPSISLGATVSPNNCTNPNGSITINGIIPNVRDTINYVYTTSSTSSNVSIPIPASNTSTSYTITNVAAGTYNITLAYNGCTSPNITQILTAPSSTQTPIASNDTTICSGGTLNFAVLNPVSGNSTVYNWTGPASFSLTNTSSVSIPNTSIANAGWYLVTATQNQCTSIPDSIYATINPLPTKPGVRDTTYCQNATPQSIFSLVTPSAGNTITWYNVNGTIAATAPTPSTATVTPPLIKYLVSQTNTSTGCVSPKDTIRITVNPTPTIANQNITICSGFNFKVKPTGVPQGTQYTWLNPVSSPVGVVTGGSASALPIDSIAQLLFNNSNAPATLTYTVFPKTGNCAGNAFNIIVTVNPNPIINVDSQTICHQSSATLTANGATNYSWTPSTGLSATTGSSVTASPTNTGQTQTNILYTVIGSFATGCSDTTYSLVKINPLPVKPGVRDTTYCQNTINTNAASLTATSSINTVLNWFNSSNQSLPSAPSPSVGTVNNTVYYVSQTDTTTGCTGPKDTIRVRVNSTPVVTAYPIDPSICASSTGKIIIKGLVNGSSYLVKYDTSNVTVTIPNQIANGDSIIINNLQAGNYFNIRVFLVGCESNSLNLTLSNPSPPATPTATTNATICSGKTLTLSANTTSAGVANYSWTGPNGFTSFLQNPSIPNVIVADTGTYYVTVTISGCRSNAGSVHVMIDSTPAKPVIVTNSPLCSDSTLNLSVTTASTMQVNWLWTYPNGITSASQNNTIPNTTTANGGNYTVVVTSLTGNCKDSAIKFVTINLTPVISSAIPINPTLCQTKTGSIILHGLIQGTSYVVRYKRNGIDTTVNGLVAVGDSVIISNLSSGIYSSIYVVTTGCPSNQVGPFTLTDPNPPAAPVLTSNSPICTNETLQINVTSPVSNTVGVYNWTTPRNAQPTGSSITINNASILDSGTYIVTLTINNCTSSPTTLLYDVHSRPLAPVVTSPVVYCQLQTASALTATALSGNSLLWYTTASGGVGNNVAPTPSTTNTGTTSYFVSQVNVYGCEGPRSQINVTVNPTPVVGDTTINVCSGTSFSITPPVGAGIPAGTVYSWSAPTSFGIIGGQADSNQVSIIGNLIDTTDFQQTAVYNTVIPKTGSCSGLPFKVTVVVNPGPRVVYTPGNQKICSGDLFATVSLTSATPNVSIPWSLVNAPITVTGLVTSGNGTIPSQQLSNLTNSPVTLNYSATASTTVGASCPGNPVPYIIIVNPTPIIHDTSFTICSGNSFSFSPINNQPYNIVPRNTTYTWTVSPNSYVVGQSDTTLPASSIGHTLINLSNVTQFLTYHVTPTSGDSGFCKGNDFDILVTIYPKPQVLTLYDTICSGNSFLLNPINAQPNDSMIIPAGTFYNWSAPFVTGITGTTPGINQSNISNTVSNNTFAPITVKYIVTPTSGTSGACIGDQFEVYVTVNPLSAISNNPLYQKICNEGITNPIVWTSLTSGAHYSWTLVSSGNVTGFIPNAVSDTMPSMQLYNSGDDVDSVVYAISSTSNACAAPATNFTFYVNPDARDTFAFTKDTACWPFVIDNSVITNLSPNTSNGTYNWYVINYNSSTPQEVLIGTGYNFPGYTIQNPDDSIDIKLVGFSQYGCKGDSITHRFYTRHKAIPNFSFTYNPASACGPNSVTFTNTTPFINSFNYQWNFGTPPNIQTPPPSLLTSNLAQPPSVLYQPDLNDYITAVYQVKLTVYSNDFCEIKDTTINVVIESKPKSLFVPDVPRPCSNTNIHFTNASLPNVPPDTSTTYTWDFGDGSPLYVTNNRYPAVQHIFNSGVVDTFTITLIAINGCGADTSTFPIIVSPITIIPAIQVTPFSQIGCAPHEVVVVNNSSGGQTYTWDFGDATQIVTTGQSTPDTIKHTYTQCGNYTVVGHAYNACSDTASNVFVKILCKPQPRFTPINSGECVGHQVYFANQTITADSANTRYIWHFQDGTTDSGYSPVHVYPSPGVYHDTLIAILFDLTSSISCSNVYVGTVTIIDSVRGNITINGSRGNCTPSTVTFINNNRPTSVAATWDFGDGSPFATGDSVTHTYTAIGTYVIQMNSVEIGGCKNYYTDTVKIGGAQGQLIYSANNVCLPYTATKFEAITNAATDSIHWYFGDGRDTTTFNTSTNPSTIIYHQYTSPGAYTPYMVLYASQGLCTVTVIGATPIRVDSINAGFRFTDNKVCDSTQINFFDTSYAYSGVQYSIWSYGTGGVNDTALVSSHYYTINNTYQITHTVISNLGCRDTSKQNVVIRLKETPNVQIQGLSSICIYTSGTYTAQTISTTDSINYYNWTVTNPSGNVVNTSVDTFINISFRDSGVYNIRLIIGTTFGCYDTINKLVTVIPSSIKINYTMNSVGCTPHVVQIINNSVGANTYSWNFGDVAGPIPPTSANTLVTGPGQTVTHTYQNPGTYYITMLAQNGGCTDTTIIDSIKVLPKPIASFSFTANDNCVNHTIQFNNTTNIPAQYSWNFGDLTAPSTAQNPTHLYSTAGTYTATLTSSISYPNGLTCSTNFNLPIVIIDTLQGNVTVSGRYGICKPFTVTFTNNIRPVRSISWNFGDGTPFGTTDVVTHTYTDTGTYIVQMIAIDAGGCKYKHTDTIVVGGAAGNMQYSSNVACLPYGTTRLEILTNAATDSIHWYFGDGDSAVTINGVGVTSTIINYHYNFPGIYNPRAVLYSQGGACIVPIQGPIPVKVDSVSAGFSYTFSQFCDTTKYFFTDHSYAFSGFQNLGWDFGFGPTTTTGSPVLNNYTIGGAYNVIETVTSQWGCVALDTIPINVIIHQYPSAQINAVDSACSNDTIYLTSVINSVDTVINNNINWTVQPPVGTSIINTGAFFNFAVTTPGKYYIYLSLTTIYGCSKTFIDSFIVYPYPSLVVGLNPKICLNQSVQLFASGANNYSWTPITIPNDLSCYTCPNPTASPRITTTYTVTSQDHGCSISKDITVTVVQPFTMTSTPNDTICIGQSSTLTANGAPNYLWTPGGFTTQSITVSPTVTTTYHLVGTDNDNCFRTDTNIVVAVGQYPVVTLGRDTVLSTGTLLPLQSSITNGPIRYYTWSPARDLDSPYVPRPIANIKNDICYTLIAENDYGCADTAKICIRVFCANSQVFIPNAFTPGDASRGNNILMVRATGIKEVKQFTIFNRWGQVVFEKQNFRPNDPSTGWDGKVKGVPATSGVFVYIAEVICENDIRYVYKGNVTLIN
jgi:PKD repeat protein